MRLAFAIVSLFPWGGLQRDCLRLARAAKQGGHEVTILAARADGELPRDLDVKVLPVRTLTNHGRNSRFSQALRRTVAGRFDRVVGFNKMPGLDVLYCGQMRFADPQRGFWSALNPRVGLPSRTASWRSPNRSCRAWRTAAERIVLLPPPINAARRRHPEFRHPEFRNDGTHDRMRSERGLADATVALLSIGTRARTNGFERTVSRFPKSRTQRFWSAAWCRKPWREPRCLIKPAVWALSVVAAAITRRRRRSGMVERLRARWRTLPACRPPVEPFHNVCGGDAVVSVKGDSAASRLTAAPE